MSPHCLTPNETGDRDYFDFTPFLSSPGAGTAILTVCEDYMPCVSWSVHTLWAELTFLSRATCSKSFQCSPSRTLLQKTWLFLNIHWLRSNLWPFRYSIDSGSQSWFPVFKATSVFRKLFHNAVLYIHVQFLTVWCHHLNYPQLYYNLVSRSVFMVRDAALIVRPD